MHGGETASRGPGMARCITDSAGSLALVNRTETPRERCGDPMAPLSIAESSRIDSQLFVRSVSCKRQASRDSYEPPPNIHSSFTEQRS